MAACAITITGTSGSVVIEYYIGTTRHSMTASFGETIYINDVATTITYTNVDGDAAATSSCITITNLPANYYIIAWETEDSYTMNIDAIYLDAIEIPLTYAIDYNTEDWKDLAGAINSLVDPRFRVVAGRKLSSYRHTINNYIIVRVLGTQVPWIRTLNVDNDSLLGPRDDHNSYIKGVISTALPTGFESYSDYTEPIPLIDP